MATRRNNYDASFKAKAVELSHVRGNAHAVAEELGISPTLIYRWRKEYKQFGKNSFTGNGRPLQTNMEKELSRVKAELRNITMDRDILKKAISIFSKSDGKIYEFMSNYLDKFSVERMCKVFEVSKTSYYRWLSKPNAVWK